MKPKLVSTIKPNASKEMMERNARSWHLRACLMPGFRIEPPASLSANAAAGGGYAGVLLGDDIAAASAAARLD